MNKYIRARSVLALSAALGLLLAGLQAQAHARLVSATPSPNSIGGAPRQVTLHFSEAVVPQFSGLTLMKAGGGAVSMRTAVSPNDRKTVVGAIAGPMGPGTYRVTWHAAAADDGHRTRGDFTFTVR
jgi:methionine-rich copper-binding protein CopC